MIPKSTAYAPVMKNLPAIGVQYRIQVFTRCHFKVCALGVGDWYECDLGEFIRNSQQCANFLFEIQVQAGPAGTDAALARRQHETPHGGENRAVNAGDHPCGQKTIGRQASWPVVLPHQKTTLLVASAPHPTKLDIQINSQPSVRCPA